MIGKNAKEGSCHYDVYYITLRDDVYVIVVCRKNAFVFLSLFFILKNINGSFSFFFVQRFSIFSKAG